MSLSDEQKAALYEEESYRQVVRKDIAPAPPKGLGAFLASPETWKWAATTLIIPVVIWLSNCSTEHKHKQDLDHQVTIADHRKSVDQLTALVPGLSSSDPKQYGIAMVALQTLADLDKPEAFTKSDDWAARLEECKGTEPSWQPLPKLYVKYHCQNFEQQKTGDPEQAKLAAQTQSLLSASAGDLKPMSPTVPITPDSAKPVEAAPPPLSTAITSQTFVYIQIYHEDQRAVAKKLMAALLEQGVPVPGIQNVLTGRTANDLQYAQKGSIDIRYYHADDLPAALSLVPVIKSISPFGQEPTIHDLSGRPHRGKLGLIEIWYPCAKAGETCKSQPNTATSSTAAK